MAARFSGRLADEQSGSQTGSGGKPRFGGTAVGEIPENQQFSFGRFFGGDPTYWEGVKHRAAAQARSAIRGASFGTIDKALAGLETLDGKSWKDANAQFQDQRKADVNTLGSAQANAIEFGGSLVNPVVAGKFLAPEAGMLKSGLAYGTEGGIKGGVNAWGHGGSGEDIAKGAAWGGGLGFLGGALASPFSKWWSGGTQAPPPPPAPPKPVTLQQVFIKPPAPPAAPPPTSRVADALDALGNASKLGTAAADTILPHFGIPPIATWASGTAKSLAPVARDYFTKGADGRLLVNPQAAQEARDALARIFVNYGASR